MQGFAERDCRDGDLGLSTLSCLFAQRNIVCILFCLLWAKLDSIACAQGFTFGRKEYISVVCSGISRGVWRTAFWTLVSTCCLHCAFFFVYLHLHVHVYIGLFYLPYCFLINIVHFIKALIVNSAGTDYLSLFLSKVDKHKKEKKSQCSNASKQGVHQFNSQTQWASLDFVVSPCVCIGFLSNTLPTHINRNM